MRIEGLGVDHNEVQTVGVGDKMTSVNKSFCEPQSSIHFALFSWLSPSDHHMDVFVGERLCQQENVVPPAIQRREPK
jgi:hypothetical protein